MKTWADYPEYLTITHMAEIIGVAVKTMYRYHGEGAYDFARIKTPKYPIRYSKARMQQHANGEVLGLTGSKLQRVS